MANSQILGLFNTNKITKINKFSKDDWQKFAIIGGVVLVLAVLGNHSTYKEISWKEFYTDYLEKNNVEKVEVIGNKWVRIIPKQESMV